MARIKIFGLGGLDEVGKNCLVAEVNESIFVFDCGLKYLNNIDLGINSVIPDFTYLIKNKHKIKGVFLSKIEVSKAYGINYLLKQIPHVPLYLTKTSYEIVKELKLLTLEQINKNLKIVGNEKLHFGNVSLQSFETATNMPGSCGYILATEDGNIIYTGSIVIEPGTFGEVFTTDLNLLIKNNVRKTILLITNVEEIRKQGFTIPNNQINKWIEQALEKTSENLYIGCYENDWYKIYHLIKYLLERKKTSQIVFFDDKYGRFFKNVASNLNPIFKNLKLIPHREIKRNKTQKNVVFFTGDQKWLFSRVLRLIHGNSLNMNLTDKDYILLLGENKFNTELSIVHTLNELYKSDAKINFVSQNQVSSMEGSAEDLRFLINLIRPQYFLPFNGYHKELTKAKDLVQHTKMNPRNVLIRNNGEKIIFQKSIMTNDVEKVSSNSVFVDNINNNNISDEVIRQRKVLATEGFVLISFAYQNLQKKTHLTSGVQVEFSGVTNNFIKINKIKDQIVKTIEVSADKNGEKNEIKMHRLIQNNIENIIYKETRKRSLVCLQIIKSN